MTRFVWQTLTITLTLLVVPSVGLAQSSEKAFNQLAQSFKPLIISSLPNPLYEKTDNWGHQAMVPVGIKWRGVKPQIIKSPRDHGEWRKLIISARDPKRTFDLRIADVKNVSDDKQTFKAYLTFQMGVYYDQQNWESGVRLWSGSVRARANVKAEMECENTLKMELAKNGLPDFVLRLRVTKAKCSYDNLVVEHINGLGGDGAKLIGRGVHEAMKQWRPDIERDLLAKANAAIVKAADTREVRVGFGGLLKSK